MCLKELIAQLHNDLYHNELVITYVITFPRFLTPLPPLCDQASSLSNHPS